jgi:hypothetical protein
LSSICLLEKILFYHYDNHGNCCSDNALITGMSMTIRLLAEARGKYRTDFLKQMVLQSAGEIELALHFGDQNSDFDVPSMFRQEIKAAKKGRLLSRVQYSGANLDLLMNDDFQRSFELFADHLHRVNKKYNRRSHFMNYLHEYFDYFHILTDAIAAKILDANITHVLFFDVPHLAIDSAIYSVAKSLNLKILILKQPFPSSVYSVQDFHDIGRIDLSSVEITGLEVRQPTSTWYMDSSWQEKAVRGRLGLTGILNFYFALAKERPRALFDFRYQKELLDLTRTTMNALPHWRSPFNRFFSFNWLEYLSHLSEMETENIDLKSDYVYVPLHLQPEMTTSTLGGLHRDQLLLIEKLCAKLPDGWKIYVKENPKQGYFAREPMFFHRFNRLSNVHMVPTDTSSESLIKHSKLVATVTGTAGIEAIETGKPALIFGHAWYRSMEGVFEFHMDTDLESISKAKIDMRLVAAQKNFLLNRMYDVNIDKGYFKRVDSFDLLENSRKVGKILCDLLLKGENTTFGNFGK